MNQQTFKQAIYPFSNLESYLKALIIIRSFWSETSFNLSLITEYINKLLNINIKEVQLKNFIDSSTQYPIDSGYHFINNISKFEETIRVFALEKNYSSQTFTSPAKSCLFCTNSDPNWCKFSNDLFTKNPTVFSSNKINKAIINIKQCRKCNSMHYLSYAVCFGTKVKTFYLQCQDHDYFQFSRESIFEIKLLRILTADILFKQTSFFGFTNAYNYLNASKDHSRFFMNAKRLADVFYCFQLHKYYTEFMPNEALKIGMYNNINPIDEVLKIIKPSLFKNFVSKWSKHNHSTDPNCNKTITMDGLWKISRLKCSYDNVVFDTIEFGEIKVGCPETPERFSYYCAKHKGHNLIFNNGAKQVSYQPKSIKRERLKRSEDVTIIYDSFVTQDNEELFLVDTNLNKNKWLIKSDLPLFLVSDYLLQKNPIDSCNTDKTKDYSCQLKCRTRGLELAATNCGIVVGYREIFLAESKTQVALMYLDICDNYQSKIPEYIVYDDGCHLKAFCEPRSNSSQRAQHFIGKKFVVDKLHIQNHTDHKCRTTCHPKLFPELNNINTVICEQINFWLGKFKYITKHMNINRFHFFIFVILDFYNKIKFEGIFNLTNESLIIKTDSRKRKLEEVYDEADDDF